MILATVATEVLATEVPRTVPAGVRELEVLCVCRSAPAAALTGRTASEPPPGPHPGKVPSTRRCAGVVRRGVRLVGIEGRVNRRTACWRTCPTSGRGPAPIPVPRTREGQKDRLVAPSAHKRLPPGRQRQAGDRVAGGGAAFKVASCDLDPESAGAGLPCCCFFSRGRTLHRRKT